MADHLVEERHGVHSVLGPGGEAGAEALFFLHESARGVEELRRETLRRRRSVAARQDVVVLRAVRRALRVFDGQRRDQLEPWNRGEGRKRLGVERQGWQHPHDLEPFAVHGDRPAPPPPDRRESVPSKSRRPSRTFTPAPGRSSSSRNARPSSGSIASISKNEAETRRAPTRSGSRPSPLKVTFEPDTSAMDSSDGTSSFRSKYCAIENQSSSTPTPGARCHRTYSRSWSGNASGFNSTAVDDARDGRCGADRKSERQHDDG